MLNEAHLQELLEKALAGKASDEELRTLVEVLQKDEQLQITEEVAVLLSNRSAQHPLPTTERVDQMADAILQADKLPANVPLSIARKAPVIALWKKIAVAACIAAVAIAAFWGWPDAKQPANQPGGHVEITQDDANPGNNKARLILADGSTVLLDTLANGALSLQGNTRIAKQKDGQLAYSSVTTNPGANNNTPAGPLYNTVVVPRGGQYQLILADGTQVWLNAASHLRFPVEFTDSERIVDLEGEGYFEVAKDAAKPFIVRTQQANVQVLGTHFNVCAYSGEDWKTTLLEGKVSVKPANLPASYRLPLTSVFLQPGQQAIIAAQPSKANQPFKIPVQTADIDEAIAWKEGYFQFNDASVKTIMQQVSRWYDVDIVYKDTASQRSFNGRINRTIKLSGVVNALKQGGINCTIDKNTLLVNP